jgi:hypothetical protein
VSIEFVDKYVRMAADPQHVPYVVMPTGFPPFEGNVPDLPFHMSNRLALCERHNSISLNPSLSNGNGVPAANGVAVRFLTEHTEREEQDSRADDTNPNVSRV